MNRTAIKNFATWARRTLREQVRARAAQFGIIPSEILAVQAVGGGLIVAGQTLNADEAEQYQLLRKAPARLDADSQAGAGGGGAD